MQTTPSDPIKPAADAPIAPIAKDYTKCPRDPITNRPILGAGPGRGKGTKSKHTVAQELFAQRVLGGSSNPAKGMEEYFDKLRGRLMAGTLAPQVELFLLHCLVGKPVERIVVRDKTLPMAPLTSEELRDRALVIAHRASERAAEEESGDDAVH